MANKLRKLLALIMALSLCMSLLSVTALADGVEEEHAGTKEAPNVTITVTPSVKDEETGNTSQTTTTEKDWKEDNTDPNTGVGTKIEGSETKEQTIVTDEDGNQIRDCGTVNGSEKTTTVTKSDPTQESDPVTAEGTPEFGEGGSNLSVTLQPGETKNDHKTPVKPDDVGPISKPDESESVTTGGDAQPNDQGGTTTTTTTTTTESTNITESSTSTVTDRTLQAALSEAVSNSTLDNVREIDDDTNTLQVVQQVLREKKVDEEVIVAINEATALKALQKINNKVSLAEEDEWVRTLDAYLNAHEASAPATPDVIVSNVNFTVGDKAQGSEDGKSDVYNTSVQLNVVVTQNVFTNQFVVKVLQGSQEVGCVRFDSSSASENDDVIVNLDGSYTVNISNVLLTENTAVNLQIDLEGVQDLGKKVYVYETTVNTGDTETEPADKQMASDDTVYNGNDKNTIRDNRITDTGEWKATQTLVLNNGTRITLSNQNGKDSTAAKITTTQDIEVNYIVVKAGDYYLKYPVEGGVLKAGTTYYVDSVPKQQDGKTGRYGISHISLYGTGDLSGSSETEKQAQLGLKGQSRDVNLGTNLGLNFNVEEATVKTTTVTKKTTATTTTVETVRTWSDSWNNSTNPDSEPDPETKPDPDPKPTPDPEETVIGDNDTPLTDLPEENVPLEDLPDEEVPLEEIPEEEVPLAAVPKTGDMSVLWLALSALSGTGLAGVSLLGRKKREDEE